MIVALVAIAATFLVSRLLLRRLASDKRTARALASVHIISLFMTSVLWVLACAVYAVVIWTEGLGVLAILAVSTTFEVVGWSLWTFLVAQSVWFVFDAVRNSKPS